MPATKKVAVENGSGESSIVTFRVPTTEVEKLEKRMKKKPIVGIRSVHQYSRKLFLDFIHGKVIYLNPTDMSEDPAMSR